MKRRMRCIGLLTLLGILPKVLLASVTASGAFVTAVPIDIPEYRGLQPELGFEYNSQIGNGLLGVGWRLRGLSEIRATSATGGVATGAAMDKFWLDGNMMIPCLNAPTGSRIAASPSCKYAPPSPLVAYTSHIETYRRIAFEPGANGGRWLVWGKNGTRSTYARARDIALWRITETTDVLGNTVRYEYRNAPVGPSPDYLDTITYNSTRIKFYWEARPDVLSIPASGTTALIAERLRSVDVQVEGQRRGAYALAYHISPGSGRSVIDSIRRFGTSAVVSADGAMSGNSLPPATLEYSDAPPANSWKSARSLPFLPTGIGTPALPDRYVYTTESVPRGVYFQFVAGDYDGDGRTDGMILSVRRDPSLPKTQGNSATPQTAMLSTHVRLAQQVWMASTVPFPADADWNDIPLDGRNQLAEASVADVNGDGFDDLILMTWAPVVANALNGMLTLKLNAALSNGNGTFRLATPQFTTTPWTTAGVHGVHKNLFPPDTPICTPGDFNGDGRADFACTFQDSISKHFLGVAYARSDGSFSASPGQVIEIADDPGTLVPATNAVLPFETRRLAAGDANNDGLTDIFVLNLDAAGVSACAEAGDPVNNRSNCAINYELLTFTSRGDGFDRRTTPTTWEWHNFFDRAPGSLSTADLNGDSRADILFISGSLRGERFQTMKALHAAVSRNDGTYTLSQRTLSSPASDVQVAFAFGDANGDGRSDLLVATPVDPGAGVSCSAATFRRPVLTTVFAQADGDLTLPTRWDDCSQSLEVRDVYARWEKNIAGMAQIVAGDTNGDGRADLLLPVLPNLTPETAIFGIYDKVSQLGPNTVRRWIGADLNGDGRADFVSFIHQTNQVSALSLLAQPDGRYRSVLYRLATFDNPALQTWRVADVNADGRADIVHVQCRDTTITEACALLAQSFVSRGDGTFVRGTQSQPLRAPGTIPASLAALRLADVDDDGRADIVQPVLFVNPASGALSLAVRTLRFDGDTWAQLPLQSAPLTGAPPALLRTLTNALAWHVGDYDGDGRVDLMHVVSGTNDMRLTQVSLGLAGWSAISTPVAHPSIAGGWNVYKGREAVRRWRVADVNGDGLHDLVRLIASDNTSLVHTVFSLGANAWRPDFTPLTLPAAGTVAQSFGSHDFDNVDANGDGREDFLYIETAPNDTVVATVLLAGNAGSFSVSQQTIATANSNFEPKPTRQYLDLAGNGERAIAYVDTASTGALRVRSVTLAQTADRLRRAGSGGAFTEVSYAPAGRFVDAAAGAACGIPHGLAVHVAAQTRIGDGRRTQTEVTRYTYSCPVWSYVLRGLLGFELVNATVDAQQNRPTAVIESRFQHSDACATLPTVQSTRNAAGQFVGPRSIIAYQPAGSEAPYTCRINYVQELVHGSSGAIPAMNLQTSFRYDEFGNEIAKVEDGFFGMARATLRSFKYATAPYVVDSVATEQLHNGPDSSGRLLRAKIFCYDGDTSFTCNSPLIRGQLTMVIDIWEQGTRLTKFFYDAVGNLAGATDANNHGIAYAFDPVQRTYPVGIVNALGQQVATLQWDRVLGLVRRVTGLNGEFAEYQYDEFGRLERTRMPSGGIMRRSYEFWGDPRQQRVTDVVEDGSPDGLWTRQYLDGLGRLYRVERKSERPNEVLGQRIVYSDMSERPFRISRFSRWQTSGPWRARAYTSYYYDVAGRPTRIVNPDKSDVELRYEASANRLGTTIVDEKGESTQSVRDAFDRLIEVRSFDGPRTITSRYEYDGADQINLVIDPNGNPTRYTWDLLGRNRTIVDPNLGTRTQGYDLVGNLVSVTDARNRTITFTYDELNRRTAKRYPSGQTVRWFYDSPTVANGLGRLTSFVDLTTRNCGNDPGGLINYNASGQVATVSRCIAGVRATMKFDYDTLGRVRSLTYPDNEVVNYQYNTAGQLASVPGLLRIRQWEPSGLPTDLRYANGATRRVTFNSRRAWLMELRDTTKSQVIFDASYDYEPNGWLKLHMSQSHQTNLTMTYDGVGRLRSVSGTQTQSWTYDNAGNMTSNSTLGIYTYPNQGAMACVNAGVSGPCEQPHGVASAGHYDLRYDDNGLLSMMTDRTTGATRSIDWTVDAQPNLVADFDGTQTMYEYDAFGNRVIEVRGPETITYFGPLARRSSLTGFTNIYAAGPRVIGSKTLGARLFWHTDRAGAVRAVTDENGQLLGKTNYNPFGEARPLPGVSARIARFGGIDIDAGAGLQAMGARFYDRMLGRFISPDTIIPDALNTQAINRYSFVYNNPFGYVDPSGHQALGIGDVFGRSPDLQLTFNFSPASFRNPSTPFVAGMNGTPLAPAVLSSPIDELSGVYIDSIFSDRDTFYQLAGLVVDMWENKEEAGFGAVTGGLQALIPAGWALPADQTPELLGLYFDEGQEAYFNLTRGLVLAIAGGIKVFSGLEMMASGALPTIVGAATAETGIGLIGLAGGAAIEVVGVITVADGAADSIVGTIILTRSGVYILRDRFNILRYGGKARSFSGRKSGHKASKPKHKFEELWEINDPNIRAGAEQWLLEHCPTCDWNKISGMSVKNKKFDWRVIKFIEWHLKKFGKMPPRLFQ